MIVDLAHKSAYHIVSLSMVAGQKFSSLPTESYDGANVVAIQVLSTTAAANFYFKTDDGHPFSVSPGQTYTFNINSIKELDLLIGSEPIELHFFKSQP